MKHLVGKKMTTKVKFMGEDVTIRKLTVAEILKIQDANKKAKEGDEIKTLGLVIRSGVEGAEELTDDQLTSFPLDELSALSSEVVKFSGMNADSGN